MRQSVTRELVVCKVHKDSCQEVFVSQIYIHLQGNKLAPSLLLLIGLSLDMLNLSIFVGTKYKNVKRVNTHMLIFSISSLYIIRLIPEGKPQKEGQPNRFSIFFCMNSSVHI